MLSSYKLPYIVQNGASGGSTPASGVPGNSTGKTTGGGGGASTASYMSTAVEGLSGTAEQSLGGAGGHSGGRGTIINTSYPIYIFADLGESRLPGAASAASGVTGNNGSSAGLAGYSTGGSGGSGVYASDNAGTTLTAGDGGIASTYGAGGGGGGSASVIFNINPRSVNSGNGGAGSPGALIIGW
jgi:hypothetical protein